MSKLDDALRFAIEAHAGMRRKGDDVPYILHPLEVVTIAASLTSDEDVLCAAALHDVVEDTPHTTEELREAFGPRVAELVAAETEDKRHGRSAEQTWLTRKRESIAELRATDDCGVRVIWLADKLSNMRSFIRLRRARGAAMWDRFHQQDPAMQAWYYRQVAAATRELSDQPAWQEYVRLAREVFAADWAEGVDDE